ncbi:MAG TPA: 3-deoxy-7-phosphoheptulonate synthase [Polyangiaceae bacterium]|jgi:3-deoxy-7-phosphoheptulonate synthase|nr:3-deoxy-7-phosphoheptulonate synthase [Polyangiaceae bacterium]
MERTRNLRVESVRPLLSPAILLEEVAVSDAAAHVLLEGRRQASRILHGEDDRLLAVVGPCSIHDPKAAVEYASRLRKVQRELEDDLYIMMRVYFEKPRTTIGWKGLINDPYLDETFQINEGLRRARRVLLELSELGLPCATEFLDPITPQFIADLVAWGAIGARTTESQVHRQLASGLSMPIGFKNGTHGTVQLAVDAVVSAAHPHRFLGVTEQGLAAIVQTTGNPDCHVILRGGATGPNFDEPSVKKTADLLDKAGLRASVLVDCSHGNSSKDFKKQPEVAHEIARQVAAGSTAVFGVMVESFLTEGRQELKDPANLVYGQSVTDACIGWDATIPVLVELAAAVRARRAAKSR